MNLFNCWCLAELAMSLGEWLRKAAPYAALAALGWLLW